MVSLCRLPLKLKGFKLGSVVDGFLYASLIGEPPLPASGTTAGPCSGKQKSFFVWICDSLSDVLSVSIWESFGCTPEVIMMGEVRAGCE